MKRREFIAGLAGAATWPLAARAQQSPDPVGLGFVETFSRPGGHMTGFISFDAPIIGKWVQLLKEMAPAISRVAAIYNLDTALSPSLDREIAAAASFGVAVVRVEVRHPIALEDAIAFEGSEPGRGVMVLPDSFGTRHRDLIIAAANRSPPRPSARS